MKYCFLMLILAAAALGGLGCEPKNANQQPHTDTKPEHSQAWGPGKKPTTDAEPLLLNDEPLLPDTDEDGNSLEGPIADNSRCHVCHINYTQEDIAVIHARANISCEQCHGASDAHIADESWAWGGNGTAPDIMYPRSRINPACMSCHPRDKIDTTDRKSVV